MPDDPVEEGFAIFIEKLPLKGVIYLLGVSVVLDQGLIGSRKQLLKVLAAKFGEKLEDFIYDVPVDSFHFVELRNRH